MRLSDGWMIIAVLAFTMYVVLDGYDLGIGVLTLFERDTSRRREMSDLVAWVWDGNESWLVLVALTLWIGIYPRPFFDYINGPVDRIVREINPAFYQQSPPAPLASTGEGN